MFTSAGGVAEVSLSRLAWVFFLAAIASPCADHPSQASAKQPVVTSVTQVTRDIVDEASRVRDGALSVGDEHAIRKAITGEKIGTLVKN